MVRWDNITIPHPVITFAFNDNIFINVVNLSISYPSSHRTLARATFNVMSFLRLYPGSCYFRFRVIPRMYPYSCHATFDFISFLECILTCAMLLSMSCPSSGCTLAHATFDFVSFLGCTLTHAMLLSISCPFSG